MTRTRAPVIDGHCHAGTGDGLLGPWDTAAPLGAYLRRADAAGISKTVIMAPFHSDYAVANAEVARIAAQHQGRLIPFAFVHAKRDAGRIGQMVSHAVREWGFRGIKVHRKDAPATREVCEVALEFGLPVLYDPLGEMSLVELIVPEYPGVNFIIPHFGSFADDWHAHAQLIDQMERFPNLYADTSGVKRFDYLVEAVTRLGPRRIIFGSDGPWLHPGLELAKIHLLGLPSGYRELISGGNIARLIRPRPGPALRRQRWVLPGLSRRVRSGALVAHGR